jgi:hypothetical protein
MSQPRAILTPALTRKYFVQFLLPLFPVETRRTSPRDAILLCRTRAAFVNSPPSLANSSIVLPAHCRFLLENHDRSTNPRTHLAVMPLWSFVANVMQKMPTMICQLLSFLAIHISLTAFAGMDEILKDPA